MISDAPRIPTTKESSDDETTPVGAPLNPNRSPPRCPAVSKSSTDDEPFSTIQNPPVEPGAIPHASLSIVSTFDVPYSFVFAASDTTANPGGGAGAWVVVSEEQPSTARNPKSSAIRK